MNVGRILAGASRKRKKTAGILSFSSLEQLYCGAKRRLNLLSEVFDSHTTICSRLLAWPILFSEVSGHLKNKPHDLVRLADHPRWFHFSLLIEE